MPKFLNVDFDPNINVIRQDLARFENSFKDKRQAMLASLAVAQHEVEEMFDEERDAFGKRWHPWRGTYKKVAESLPNVAILNRSNAPDGLRASATSSTAFAIKGGFLTYGTGLPRWAGTHLHGSGPKNLPQRSFYPYSTAGAAKVHSIFDAWALNNMAIMSRVGPRGKKFTQVQTRIGGRFGPSPF